MDNSGRERVARVRRPDADAVQRAAADAPARPVPVGLGVHHHHDRVRLHQRVPHQHRHDQFYQVSGENCKLISTITSEGNIFAAVEVRCQSNPCIALSPFFTNNT